MERALKAKASSYGLVELRTSGTNYTIYVKGQLKISTGDLMYALSEFDKY